MFYITISNGLLKDGHRKRIGSAVWEFMWLIDKITKIDDKGMGWVLGGKPINLKDISDGMDEETISRNLNKLEHEGYIKKIRTPHGLSIRVIKAKKRFGKNVESNTIHKNVETPLENVESNIRQYNDNTNKTSEQSSGVSKKMKYKETTIDFDTGLPTEEKPKAHKREDCIKLANLFDKLASEYSKRPIATPKSYFIVLNAMNPPHNLKLKGIIKLFDDWFNNEKMKMEDKVKLSWCLGKDNINSFKVKN